MASLFREVINPPNPIAIEPHSPVLSDEAALAKFDRLRATLGSEEFLIEGRMRTINELVGEIDAEAELASQIEGCAIGKLPE